MDVQVVGENHDLPAGPQQDAQAPVDFGNPPPANRPVGQQDEVVVPPAQMEVEVDGEQPAGPNAGPNAEIGEKRARG